MNFHIFACGNKKSSDWHPPRKKKAAILCCIFCVLVLSGCSAAKDFILRYSGVMSKEEYQKYTELRDSGQLDETGRYTLAALEDTQEFSPPADSIHVTFAENAYITISYYLDADHKVPINIQQCYLKPGDSIYASEPECHHPSSNWYSFDRFCVYEYDTEGNKSHELLWSDEESLSPLVLHIPEDYTGNEISIVPLGKYENRQLELTDYYTDSSGHLQELNGTWIINDTETTSSIIEVSPVEPITIDYKYDPDKYCYLSSNPSSFYHENGLVRFDITSASANISSYSVELRSLEGIFLFNPVLYSAEHGTVTFKYNDKELTETSYIPDGQAIQYTAEPDAGYTHPEGTGKIIVSAVNPDETDAKIRDIIKFYSDTQSIVILPQPSGGRIIYTANGTRLTGSSCALLSGTEITMEFRPWNGWICDVEDGEKYKVQDGKQTVSLADGRNIYQDVFREADSHKPLLNIMLTDSAKDVKFDISAPGIKAKANLNYAAGDKASPLPDLLGQNDRIIFSGKVGTDSSISLTAKDDTLLAGEALKLEISKEDTDGVKYKSIQYITKLPYSSEIDLYEGQLVSASSIVFETVTVTISKVKVVSYSAPSSAYATIRAALNDVTDHSVLKSGDMLEPSREVTITITPQIGYYISGANDTRGIYSKSMKYSAWEKDAEKILAEHSAVKLWYVTLNTADSYGTCTYKLDGTVVSGRVSIREGQKLTLEYTLTDPNYQIVRSSLTGFIGNIIHNQTEPYAIPVSKELDGKTIQRSDYITVERKEG